MEEVKKELTPEQIQAKRERNRAKNERKKLAKAQAKNDESPQPKNTQPQNKNTQPQLANNANQNKREVLTDEEYNKRQVEFKSKKIQENPKSAVVSIAEASEARTLAYSIRDINMIAEFVRNNMGSERVPMEVGTHLISHFRDNVEKSLQEYVDLANSYGIGGKRSLFEYRQEQKKIKNRELAEENFRNKVIENENASETKEREQQEKALEKAQAEIDKLKESLEKAVLTKIEASEALSQGYQNRHAAQKERRLESAKKAEAAQQEKDAETPSKEDEVA